MIRRRNWGLTDVIIGIKPLTPAAGAEISGVTLSADIDDDTLAEVHAALVRHHVIFFRDQPLSPVDQAGFARRLGRTRVAQKAAFGVMEDVPEMAILLNDRAAPPNVDHYHVDGLFRANPEFAAMLHAVELPSVGGDTIFVSLTRAYDALSDGMKSYLADKQAVADFMKLHGSPKKAKSWDGDNAERMERMRRLNPPVAHPLVKTHPVSGKTHLFLSESFTTHVVNVPDEESRGLLDFLLHHVRKAEFQCRFKWEFGSTAIWDNRAALHYAVADYWPERRLMHRVTIESDRLGQWDPGEAAVERG